MTLLQSLLVKLGLLVAAVGFVAWIGWPVEERQVTDPAGSSPPTATTTVETPPSHEVSSHEASPQRSQKILQQPGPAAKTQMAKLDLNRATPEELQRLPG